MRTFLTAAVIAVLPIVAVVVNLAEAQHPNRDFRRPRAANATPNNVRVPESPAGNQVVKRLADLVIAQVSPDADGRPPRTITIRNQGGTVADAFTITVRANNGYGNLLYQVEIPIRSSLPPSASRTYNLYASNGGSSYSVKIDSKNQVRESNENNNFWANNRLR